MKKDIKVVAIQAKVPKSIKEGESQIERLLKKATLKAVDIIGLPEDCLAPFSDVVKGYDPLGFLSQIAKKHKVYLFGANIVKENDGTIYNTGFLFDKKGKLISRHKKIVLTPPEEKGGIKPGNTLEVFDTEFGKMSIIICKDSFHRYAAWFFDKLRKAGVDIVLIPSYSLNVSQRSIELWVDSLKALSKWFDV